MNTGSVMDLLLMLVTLLGLAALGSRNLKRLTCLVAAQGIVLGALFVVAHLHELDARLLALAVLSILLKGLAFPWLLLRSMREAGAQQEVDPYVGVNLSLVLGAAALTVAFALAPRLELPIEAESRFIVPVSLATVFIGLLLLVARRKAVTQALGYIVLENGIAVFGLILATRLPALVEMGVLLDLFVAVFVMGIIIFQINREFEHIDASRLRELQDRSPAPRRWPWGRRNHNNHRAPLATRQGGA